MNNSFYAIEIASAAHDQQYREQIDEARLAQAIRSGHSSLLSRVLHMFAGAL